MDGNRFDDATKTLVGRVATRRAALTAAAFTTGGALRSLAMPPAVEARRRALKLAYRCPAGENNGSLSGSGDARYAQVFAATRSGTLRKIQIAITKDSGTTGDYVVQLLKVVGGVPSNSPLDVLAAVTIPDASVPNGDSMLTGNFVGTRLALGTEYAAVVSRPGATNLGVRFIGAGDCPGGTMFTAGGTGAFFASGSTFSGPWDLIVSVFVA